MIDLDLMIDRNHKSQKPIECRGRWHFLEGESGEEVQRKAYAIERIDQFWREFRTSELCGPRADLDLYREKAAAWMLEHFPLAEPRLEWEITYVDEGKSQLSICLGGGGSFSQWRLLETFVARAGEFDSWEVVAGRVPLTLDQCDITSVFESRLRMTLPPFHFELRVEKDSSVTLKLFSPAFSEPDLEEDLAIPLYLCEMLMGEYAATHWVVRNEVEYKPIDESSFDYNATANELKKCIAEQVEMLESKILDPPLALWSDKHPLALIEIAPQEPSQVALGRRQRMSVLTYWPDLIAGVVPPAMFFSDRFVKNGGKLAYLQVVNVDGELTPEFREKLEDEIIEALVVADAGCLVATGRGDPGGYYYDVCLTDPDKAIAALKKVVQGHDLPKTCWLRFYDYHWAEEWVRMYPDTPDLENPEQVW